VRIFRSQCWKQGILPLFSVFRATCGLATYIDTKVTKNEEYIYTIYVVSKDGLESEAEGPIGVRVK